jgi:hypothetical protein
MRCHMGKSKVEIREIRTSRVGTLQQQLNAKSASGLSVVSPPDDLSCPSWARTRTLLIQRGRCKPLDSSNLLPFTRVRVTRCWSLLAWMLQSAVLCSLRYRSLPTLPGFAPPTRADRAVLPEWGLRRRRPTLGLFQGRRPLRPGARPLWTSSMDGGLHHERERGAGLQPDCARALASCAATRALFVSRARLARTLSPSLSALRRSSKNGVTLRPRTSCLSASDRAVSSARS